MSYYGCETCDKNIRALLAYTDDSVDPKPIRVCKETRTLLPDSIVGCPKYPYAERKRIVDSCYICHNCKGKQESVESVSGWKPQWVTLHNNNVLTMVYRCKLTGNEVQPNGEIPDWCPYLKGER